LAAFAKRNVPGDDQSLKHRRIKFERFSVTAHANQPGVLRGYYSYTKSKISPILGYVAGKGVGKN
jgi:hypothetical protein